MPWRAPQMGEGGGQEERGVSSLDAAGDFGSIS